MTRMNWKKSSSLENLRTRGEQRIEVERERRADTISEPYITEKQLALLRKLVPHTPAHTLSGMTIREASLMITSLLK